MQIVLSPDGTARRTVELDSITVPDLWHTAAAIKNGVRLNRTVAANNSKLVLDAWHLCHDLLSALHKLDTQDDPIASGDADNQKSLL